MGILIICLQDYVRILMGEVCMSIASGSWRVNDNTKTLSIWAFLNENKRIEIWLWSTYCFSCRITKSNPTVMMTFPYVAQTSVTTTDDSPSKDYPHPNDQITRSNVPPPRLNNLSFIFMTFLNNSSQCKCNFFLPLLSTVINSVIIVSSFILSFF